MTGASCWGAARQCGTLGHKSRHGHARPALAGPNDSSFTAARPGCRPMLWMLQQQRCDGHSADPRRNAPWCPLTLVHFRNNPNRDPLHKHPNAPRARRAVLATFLVVPALRPILMLDLPPLASGGTTDLHRLLTRLGQCYRCSYRVVDHGERAHGQAIVPHRTDCLLGIRPFKFLPGSTGDVPERSHAVGVLVQWDGRAVQFCDGAIRDRF